MKSSFKLIILVLTAFLCFSCGPTRKLNKIVSKEHVQGNYMKGFVLLNPESDKELLNINGSTRFTPASNTKLFTFYTVYKTLGDSIKGLEYIEKKDSLIIKGTADPSFFNGKDSAQVYHFLTKKNKPVYFLDTSIDEPVYGQGWSWDDYPFYYMPEKSVFPMYGNILKYKYKGDSILAYPRYFSDKIALSSIQNKARDFNSNAFYLLNKRRNYTVPYKTSNELIVAMLNEILSNEVHLMEDLKSEDFNPVFSRPKDSLLKEMLVVSDNFIAEQLMLQVGKEVSNKYSVQEAIHFSLDSLLIGLPDKPRWVDGSGLSRYNLFSPNDLVFLLRKMYDDIPTEKLLNYFPVNGMSGTLKNWYKSENPYIYAKSGTLSNNYCLSGYLITKKGTLLIFSYMNNHYIQSNGTIKTEMDKAFKYIYEHY